MLPRSKGTPSGTGCSLSLSFVRANSLDVIAARDAAIQDREPQRW